MITLVTEFDEGIGSWFFAVYEGEKLLHLLHGFRSREDAQHTGDTWLQENRAAVPSGSLDELAQIHTATRDYSDLTIGEIASDLAAMAGWSVVGAIHAQTAITIDAQSHEGSVLEALEGIAQLAGLKLRAGSQPRTVEIGIF